MKNHEKTIIIILAFMMLSTSFILSILDNPYKQTEHTNIRLWVFDGWVYQQVNDPSRYCAEKEKLMVICEVYTNS